MPVTGVIIAAGRSSRMAPDHKLIMDIQGKTLIQRSLESLLPFCEKIIIVTGSNHQEIAKAVSSVIHVQLIKNPNPNEGMFSSVKVGLSHTIGTPVLFLLGDCPFTPPDLIERMLKESADIVAASYKGKIGNPILLSEKAVKEILEDETFLNLKQVLKTKAVVAVNASSEVILWDIDTHSDLHRARVYFEKMESSPENDV